MDNKDLHTKLVGIQDQFYAGSDITGKKLLAQLIGEVAKLMDKDAESVRVPEWDWKEGIISDEMLDDNTFDNGPIEIVLRRVYQQYINGCYFDITGMESIQDDNVAEKVQEFLSGEFSWDNGQYVADLYLIAMLVGKEPSQKVINAFLNGMLVIKDLDEKDVNNIFRHWPAMWERRMDPDMTFHCIQDETSDDT